MRPKWTRYFAMGIALGLVLMVVAFAVNIAVSAFRRISEK